MTALETPTALLIREPRESELPLCRMLLPEACASPTGRYFRLAFSNEKLVAALSYRDDSIALGGVRVHVIPTHRRQRIGTNLLEYAIAEARRLGRTMILADVDLKAENAAEPFLTSRGFHKLGTITFAEIDTQDLRPRIDHGQERVQSSLALPASARIVDLSEAPKQEIARLYAEYITNMRLLAGLRDSIKLDKATESIALLIGDKLAGFVLARLESRVLHIPAWVMDPQFRGHHLGPWLLYQLADRLRGRVDQLRFEFTDAAVVTARILNLPGYRVTKIAARFERALTE